MAEPLSLGYLGRVLLRYWVLIIVLTIFGAGAAYGASQLMTSVYTATATQLVKGLPGTTGSAANYEAAQYAVNRAKSYPSFVYSAAVLEGVRSDLHNSEGIVDLRKDLSATNPADTPLIQISALGSTPEEARDKANSAARHMARFITQIETVAGKSPIAVETPVEAALPTDTTSPKKLLWAALGAVVGFGVAIAIALIHAATRGSRPRHPSSAVGEFAWVTDDDPTDVPGEDVALAGPVSAAAESDLLTGDADTAVDHSTGHHSAVDHPAAEQPASNDPSPDPASAGSHVPSSHQLVRTPEERIHR